MERPTKVYRHAFLDSRRWDAFRPRPGDVVISTSIKAGTTWVQAIVAALLWPSGGQPAPVNELSPWLEMPLHPLEEVLARLEAQPHRRFVKTHLPADALPLHDEVRHLAVGRDGRDVFTSLIHHWSEMRPIVLEVASAVAEAEAIAPMPAYDGDLHGAFARWVRTGSFPWEGDGAPWWSHLRNIATWWERRDRPNVLLVHYDDLLTDLAGEMRRIAAFLDIEVAEADWPAAVERCTFASMQARAAEVVPEPMAFEDDGARFLHRGTSGQWREVLTADEVAAYERRVADALPPDAAAWLAAGRLATAG